MNFPTNKLRDVVLTLQSFDPDLQVNLENVNLIHDSAGRRILAFTTNDGEQYFLLRLNALLKDTHHFDLGTSIAEAAGGINQLTETNNKYVRLLTEQERQLDELRAKLSDLARGLNEITFAVGQIEVQLAESLGNLEQSLEED